MSNSKWASALGAKLVEVVMADEDLRKAVTDEAIQVLIDEGELIPAERLAIGKGLRLVDAERLEALEAFEAGKPVVKKTPAKKAAAKKGAKSEPEPPAAEPKPDNEAPVEGQSRPRSPLRLSPEGAPFHCETCNVEIDFARASMCNIMRRPLTCEPHEGRGNADTEPTKAFTEDEA